MEIDLQRLRFTAPVLPDGFRWQPWHVRLIERHAAVKYSGFRGEPDARVFKSLSDLEGCTRLMTDISSLPNFVPQATWLIARDADDFHAAEDVGTIQGMSQYDVLGAIQNVAVRPEYRGLGFGRALMLKALDGFQRARLRRAFLEVTASNAAAVELYRSLGFRLTQTSYRAMEEESATA